MAVALTQDAIAVAPDTEIEGHEGLQFKKQKLSDSVVITTTANGVGGGGGGQDGLLRPKKKPGRPKGNGMMDFEWQAQHFPAASSISPKKKRKADVSLFLQTLDDGDGVFVDSEDCDFELMLIHSEENDDDQKPVVAVSDAVLNAVAADTVSVADLAVDATFDCDEKTKTQAPSPPLPNTSAVAAATAASIVPTKTNIMSTTKIQHTYRKGNTSIASSLRGQLTTVVKVHTAPGFLGFILKQKNSTNQNPTRNYVGSDNTCPWSPYV